MSSDEIEVEETDGQEAQVGESDTGFGFYFAAGKEWWVGDKWAIGGALFAQFSNTKDKGPDENPITNRYFGINFTVTYD